MDSSLVLVVEDNPDDVLLLRRAFDRAEITSPIHVVSDGQEALDYLTGQGAYADRSRFPLPAVILVDLQMPRLSGLELLGRLREHANLRLIPTVVLTSSRDQRDIREAYDLGANSYIVKSDKVVEMAQAIHAYWLRTNETAQQHAS